MSELPNKNNGNPEITRYLTSEPVPAELIFTKVGQPRGKTKYERLNLAFGEENVGWKIVETDKSGLVNVAVLSAGEAHFLKAKEENQ